MTEKLAFVLKLILKFTAFIKLNKTYKYFKCITYLYFNYPLLFNKLMFVLDNLNLFYIETI